MESNSIFHAALCRYRSIPENYPKLLKHRNFEVILNVAKLNALVLPVKQLWSVQIEKCQKWRAVGGIWPVLGGSVDCNFFFRQAESIFIKFSEHQIFLFCAAYLIIYRLYMRYFAIQPINLRMLRITQIRSKLFYTYFRLLIIFLLSDLSVSNFRKKMRKPLKVQKCQLVHRNPGSFWAWV